MSTNISKSQSILNIQSLARFIVILNGVMNVLPGLALLFAPAWFFQIANFPPFNQHFMGDAGAFSLAIGVGLLFAARDPFQHRLLIGSAALGGLVHVGNHLYDDFVVRGGASPNLITNTLPLFVLAALLLGVVILPARPTRSSRSAP
jgi:hypothetical protein